ncbi:hypothetical protein J2T55_001839 [Methylohalomonas lacus]|uniref:Uncharacterized protein n=1 Tax=Methylohalomonas lacus TaxID=398773 RepID=A0AAE3L5R4_9GAMM|nr:hypothetical protein [Methylohalomonas lacus]MCS3903807.1 hypothetical protein [Methylohalomonas lacus]
MPHWKLAELDNEQLAIVHEAEQSLHLDYLLLYRESDAHAAAFRPPPELRFARLSDSEMECLQGMEKNLGAVAIAYERAAG